MSNQVNRKNSHVKHTMTGQLQTDATKARIEPKDQNPTLEELNAIAQEDQQQEKGEIIMGVEEVDINSEEFSAILADDGSDTEANSEQMDVVGDESVGGTAATPDQDIVDDLGAAVGLEVDDRSFLRTTDMMEERDDRRWELDPKSSEDYQTRKN